MFKDIEIILSFIGTIIWLIWCVVMLILWHKLIPRLVDVLFG